MAKKYDLNDLGEIYGNLGQEVVAESTETLTVGDTKADVGEANLEDGGPTEEGGFEEVEADVVKSDSDDNSHKVRDFSYGKDKAGKLNSPNYPNTAEVEEEDEEESSEEVVEIEESGINNSMAKKSIFDELYAKVISEDFGMEEVDDLDALGIDEATPDAELEDDDAEGEDEVTVTLDKETAKKLCDLLKAAMGEEETDDEDGDEDVADELEVELDGEEDNEGEPKAHTTHVDNGDNNKVGHADGLGGQSSGHGDGGKSAGQQKHSAAVKDGKSNKVGNLAKGQDAFGDLKVEPAKKA